MFFTGNTCALARPIEQLWSLKAHNQVKYFLNYPKLTIHKVGLLGKLDCSGEPQAETNRLYLLVDKSRRDE